MFEFDILLNKLVVDTYGINYPFALVFGQVPAAACGGTPAGGGTPANKGTQQTAETKGGGGKPTHPITRLLDRPLDGSGQWSSTFDSSEPPVGGSRAV